MRFTHGRAISVEPEQAAAHRPVGHTCGRQSTEYAPCTLHAQVVSGGNPRWARCSPTDQLRANDTFCAQAKLHAAIGSQVRCCVTACARLIVAALLLLLSRQRSHSESCIVLLLNKGCCKGLHCASPGSLRLADCYKTR